MVVEVEKCEEAATPVELSNSLSAFGEPIVAMLHPVIQGTFEYTVDNHDLTKNVVVNDGTVTQALGMAVCTTSTTTGSSACLVSKQHARYHAGFGGRLRCTALFTSPIAGTEQYVGLMDEVGSSEAFKNGYGIGYDGITFGVQRWRNDKLFTIALADCDDPLNGEGPSGMLLDQTKLNVFEIRFQYLGGGAIEYFVENQKTGKLISFHKVLYANLNTEPSVHNPNFHFTLWAANKATTDNLIIKSSSYGYFVEGVTTFIELQQPQHATGEQSKAGVTTEEAIFTIRNRAQYASKTNFIDILIEFVSASIEASSANNLGSIRIVKDATLGGIPVYNNIDTDNSIVEMDVAGTTVTGGEELLAIPLAGKNDKFVEDLTKLRFLLNPGETMTLAGTSANNATIKAATLWRELF